MSTTLKNIIVEELPLDSIKENYRRSVKNACSSEVDPEVFPNAEIIHINHDLLKKLDIPGLSNSNDILMYFSSKNKLLNSVSYSWNYAGHQFGNWAGQLGDGRAINLTDLLVQSKLFSLQLKGAGPTPYSRKGDGYAVLRSSIREYLASEAMHHLRVPTTRALGILTSGKNVMRDPLYNGNPIYEKGAIVCRVSESFIRFGNFELLSSQNDLKNLKKLADFVIKYHFPTLQKSRSPYLELFEEIAIKTQKLTMEWLRVGFVHGVLNTDNMSILGQTIDYGPFGFLDHFDPNWTPNTSDFDQKRYRFSSQISIGLWNLYQLANALYPIIEDSKELERILKDYQNTAHKNYLTVMLKKLGLNIDPQLDDFVWKLEENMTKTPVDYTIFFRNLSQFDEENPHKWFDIIKDSLYQELETNQLLSWEKWFHSYASELKNQGNSRLRRKEEMDQVNPKYILRNYMADACISAAEKGDFSLFNEFYLLLQNPYEEQFEYEKWFKRNPFWTKENPNSSTLSCSS
ncbi:MAG: YdiU family protein [Flavobacteriales bacterium]|jgi:uncharacterized protein YdiU (UPF0061 family)|nr:YdiU family protein [Flavobacteriales bacterium]